MGHTRLGVLPRTKPWKKVVRLIEDDRAQAAIANATMQAAKKGFDPENDAVLTKSYLLLAQIPECAKQPDFANALSEIGIQVPDNPSLFDLAGAFSKAVDQSISSQADRTDLGEMAQLSGVETLMESVTSQTGALFDLSPVAVQSALSCFATRKEFGMFARKFFSNLTTRYLLHFLSCELSNHVGISGRFLNLEEHQSFKASLATHCFETCKIVEEYAGGWRSVTDFHSETNEKTLQPFLLRAMEKIRNELKREAQGG